RGRAREPGGCSHLLEMIRLFEAVLDHQVQVVALVEDLAADPGMGLLELAHLPVLLGDELLVHGRDLDEEIVVREIEVGSEPLDRFSIVVELDGERLGLVLPGDAVEVEEEGELPLAVVCERDLCRRRSFGAQVAPASLTPANSTWSGNR